ncbi:class I lanthipeptide [Xanthocytophaga flava]|uniref:class I lanthipeptide n=1 Tax=Xanthocytophaga flava TaxID=3048013 RepID=UPI0028D523CC|nr:class I lanthipeptide [Xanthocytophaga flavus]MDJ1470241.1 class I lanthipeptide [Xanthocytophaga flavus]
MKKQTASIKKLSLNKETITQLDSKDLKSVKGGRGGNPSDFRSCQTLIPPPTV